MVLVSGDGVIDIRLPRSLFGGFRSAAQGRELTVHSAARGVIAMLPSLTPDELMRLAEPPSEIDMPHISLRVGWRAVDLLMRKTQSVPLTNSALFRRLLHALLVTKEIAFVQQGGSWKLQIASEKRTTKNGFAKGEE